MSKTILGLMILGIGLCIRIRADTAAVINYLPDYYNPFAWNLKWHYKYPKTIENHEKIKFIFTLNDLVGRKRLSLWEYTLREKLTECDIYLFLQSKPAGEYTVRIDVVPCGKISNSLMFIQRPSSSHELVLAAYRQLLLPPDKEMVLAKIRQKPLNSQEFAAADMCCEKITVLMTERPATTPIAFFSLEIALRFILVDSTDQPSLKIADTSLSILSDTELILRKKAVEKDFQRGRGSLPALNAVQQELNNRKKRDSQTLIRRTTYD